MMDYHRQYNIDTKIVRIFNTYGPNMALNDGRVISNFIIQALKNEDITIYGAGTQTRSFCYVSDLVAGLIKMMNNSKQFTGPVNLGNPSERTVLELANLIDQKLVEYSNITFIIGGSYGIDESIKKKVNYHLSFSKMTFPHQLFRLLLLEQIYRSFKILNNESYHK
jgi:nucleoside-diphosphate-sugar epimerase